MTESQELAVRDGTDLLEMVPSGIKGHLENIRQFHEALLEHLKDGHDYMTIPGTQTKSLLQPGAEKVMRFFQARPHYEIVTHTEKPMKYHYRCQIIHVGTGAVIGEGDGVCSSQEDKYAYRWIGARDLPKHLKGPDDKPLPNIPMKWRKGFKGQSYPVYRVDNEELASLENTIMQMASKRAQVKAARTLGCLSGLFTQDLEDLRNVIDVGEEPEQEEAPESKKAEAPEPTPSTNSGNKTTHKEPGPGATT